MAVKCKPAETYAEYISANRDYMKEKCSKLTDCIDRLLSEENTLAVIKGENISLNKTCGLVYKPANSNYTALRGKCSAVEREEIRSDLENNIQIQLDTSRGWGPVNSCLKRLYGDSERTNRVEELCKRAVIKNEICNSSSTHRMVETFFNSEIQNLQCKCKLLAKPAEMPMPVVVGIGVGAFLVLLAIFFIGFCCYRRKQKIKRQKTNRSVVYVPGGSEGQVYQEVFDDRPFKSYQQSPSVKPPSLPSRYVHMKPGQDDGVYLEPVMTGMSYRPTLPIPQQTSNAGYESPPRYSECDRDDADQGYFRPLPDPVKVEPSDQTSTPPITEGSGPDQADDPSPPEDAPTLSSTLGPVPAKRIKKDDRKVESHYYLLEDGANKDGGDPAQS